MNALYAKACELELPVNMGANNVIIVLPSRTPAKILKWKVSVGNLISVGRVILLYDSNSGEGKTEPQKIKASQVGTVVKLLAAEGDIIHPGEPLLELEKCSHPTVMKDMCAECGADLRKDDFELHNASVPMVHSVPELKVSIERAQVLGRAEEARLLKQRKLVLLVDLDQTLIHTTNDDVLPHIKDVHHFQLHGAGSAWYHTRLRPGTHKFLENMSHLYELHICTFGSRTYAHAIAAILDHSKKFFSHRILSRDECFNPNTKTANLKALFPCGDNLVCIIDDREDVWNHAPNLVHVRPYHFFQHTGDINAPSCLSETSDYPQNEGVAASSEENQNALQKSSSSETQGDIEKEEETEDKEEENDMILGHEACVEDMDMCPKGGDEPEVNSDSNCTKDARPDVEGQSQKSCRFKDEGGGDVAGEDEIKTKGEESDTKDKAEVADDLKHKNDEEGDADEEEEDQQKKIYQKQPATEDELLELDDHDDYLLHLEDILITIHRAFYQIYDQSPEVPDLKSVVPYVRRKVLQGVQLCFSGVVPIGVPLEASRVYAVARSLGAEITNELVLQEEGSNCRGFEENSRGEKFPSCIITKRKNENLKSSSSDETSMGSSLSSNDLQNKRKPTTHLVAARLGTYKVNLGKRVKNSKLHIVTPDWLWCCAERWERVDERLFPLNKSTSVDYSRKFKNIFGEVTMRPKDAEVKDSAKTVVVGSKSTEENSIPVEVKPAAAPVISSSGSNGNDPISSSAFATYNPVTGKRVRKDGQATATVEERKRTPSGRFMDTINPLLSFSSEDLANMEDEVEEGLFDDEEDETESEVEGVRQEEEAGDLDVKESIDVEEKNVGKLSEEGKNNRKRKSSFISSSDDKEGAEEGGGDTVKHFSSEDQVKDWDYDESLEMEDGDDDEDDDKDWSMMGAALEREIMADEIE